MCEREREVCGCVCVWCVRSVCVCERERGLCVCSGERERVSVGECVQ